MGLHRAHLVRHRQGFEARLMDGQMGVRFFDLLAVRRKFGMEDALSHALPR